ncbi:MULTISPECIES: hypothetical protein [unclassified Streptomyces]|uniref:hypothetical protein n=1 Tax=unclassified Streptomyces TaxID=2593676 RepID=UPI0036BEF28B
MKITKARAAIVIASAGVAALLASPSAWAADDSGTANPVPAKPKANGDLIAEIGELELDLAALIPSFSPKS